MSLRKADQKYSINLISKYRAALMGVAIICVVLCHLKENLTIHDVAPTRLAMILSSLTVGVDVFMFLSGFGLYYSFHKNTPKYFSFIKKRLSRVIPVYVIIGGIGWFITDLFIYGRSFQRLLEDFFFVSMFTRGSLRYWFVFAIIVYYAFFPIVYACVKADHKHPVLIFLAFMLVFWVCSLALKRILPNYDDLDLAIERVPIFVIGAIFGKLSLKDKKVSLPVVVAVAVIGLGIAVLYRGYSPFRKLWSLIHYGYNLYRCFFVMGIISSFILVMEFAEKHAKCVYTFLSGIFVYLGGITLEIYLFHQTFRVFFGQPCTVLSYFGCVVILPIIAAGLYNMIRVSIKKGRISWT